MLLRAKLAACIFLFAACLPAQPRAATSQPSSTLAEPVLTLPVLGQGFVLLDGPWQFHLGDDLRWASPGLDDSGWEQIQVSNSWGSQDHPGYTGYAWYRRHVQIRTLNGSQSYALLMPPTDDAYEVYWNGQLIGRYGKLPPRPHWYYTSLIRSFAVPAAESGTIAIRVWKSPLLFVDPATLGGMYGPPLLGDADTIAAQLAASNAAPCNRTFTTTRW